ADAGITAAALRARVVEWIRATGLAPQARLDMYSWPIPSLSAIDFEEVTVAGPGWFLVGDAAGLVDPITREGIYFALLSAEWAAEAIASGHQFASDLYRYRVREGIGSELTRAADFKDAFFRAEFTTLMMDAVAHSGAIRRVVTDLIAGRQR